MRKPRILAWILAISLIAIGWFTFAEDWLVHDTDEWTITVYSPDGSYGIVIQDKNLWATMTWYGSAAPAESYWNFYQWWNNYGFPSDSNATITISSTKVDTSSYWPDNPYSSSTFVIWSGNYHNPNSDWSIEFNDNLRWWSWDDETNWWWLNSDNPITGRKWPCPEWYHIPSIWELDELAVIWYNNKYDDDLSTWYLIEEVSLQQDNTKVSSEFAQDLMIPFTSMRYWDNWEVDTDLIGFLGNFWSSTPYSEWWFTLSLIIHNFKSGILKYAVYADVGNYRSSAISVRCFKDEYVYREVSKTLTLNVMSGENLVSTGISFSDETPTSGQILDAISWLSDEVDLSTWYHFSWYIDDGGVETGFDLDTAIVWGTITSSLSITWRIEPNKYTISFLDENNTEIMSGEFTYDQEATLPANTSTKDGYTFKWWKDEQWNTYDDWATIQNLTAENGMTLEFTPIREENSQPSVSGWSSWWWHGSHTIKPDSQGQENTQNSGNEMWHGSAELENGYSKEMNDAYQFAYQNGITTMDTIQKADMEWWLTRIAMAKMLAYYAINVLWMTPDKSRVNKFGDVTEKLDSEYDNWVNLAYQLWIMWINMRKNMFRPFDLVTRAEFGTALSRMLYWLADWKKLYYETHLKKLTEEKIITNNDPNLRELRWYVMIMLMRTTMTGEDLQHYLQWTGFSDYEDNLTSQEVEHYFTEAYGMWKIYYKIWDLQRLLKYLWFYNWKINNTYDKNTVNAVYDFQVAMWILDSSDTKNPARWYLWPKTRDALNQKRAEFK